jgi:signal transduction histidine kinase
LAELAVQDDGIGVPVALRERVFDKFFRAPQQRDKQGFGLGLSIARGIVEAHGGAIHLDAPPNGHGTIVSFTVPCRGSREAR